jgi:septal ring factor EnvC (AmiA/AmiB activator)
VIKNTTNRKPSKGLLLLISCILLFFLLTPSLTSSEASNEKKKLSDIQKQLKTKKEKVKESIKKEKSVIGRIEDINKRIIQKEKELKEYDDRISQTNADIQDLSSEINTLNRKLSVRKEHLKKRLRTLYKQQYGGHALILISAHDYQDLIRKSKYVSLVAHYDNRVIKKYFASIEEVVSKKQKLEKLNEKSNADKEATRQMQSALQTDRAKKDKLLAMIRSKRKTYEKAIQDLEESSKKLRAMIKKLEKKKLPKSVTGKGFKSLKGRYPWPVQGKIAVPFGEYRDPAFKITVYKNGIEIKPERGGKPRAITGGRVAYADWFKGYGLLLIIDHGNGYHSLYGNLSEIFLQTGDILNGGTVIGRIGQSSLLNFPTLYFEIRYKGKPVDPTKWLKRKSIAKKRIRIK